jgi:hypothetical protein
MPYVVKKNNTYKNQYMTQYSSFKQNINKAKLFQKKSNAEIYLRGYYDRKIIEVEIKEKN